MKRCIQQFSFIFLFLVLLLNVIAINKNAHSQQPTVDEKNVQISIQNDSVLHFTPEAALAVVYCPSLLELDDRINNAATELMPEFRQPPEDLLAQFLASIFDAGFVSLDELEDLGLNLGNDFAVFLSSIEPPILSAIIHLSDPDALLQFIETETEGIEAVEYKDVTYWITEGNEGSYVILDDIFVFSQMPQVIENVIDIKNGEQESIVQNTNYSTLLSIIKDDTEQVVAQTNLQAIISTFHEQINEELQSTIDSIQSDPDATAALPFIEGWFDIITLFLKELNTYSVSIKIQGTDVILSQFLRFSNDGKIQELLNKMTSDDLNIIHDLPSGGFLSGGVFSNPEVLTDFANFILEAITLSNPDESNENTDELQEPLETLIKDFADLNTSFSNEIGFSVSYSESLIPDVLFIIDLKDEQKIKKYMDVQFLGQLGKIIKLLQDTAVDPIPLSMFDDIHFGPSIVHNKVEIKNIIFPNFGETFIDVDPEVAILMPQEWIWSYAFSNNQFYIGIGGEQQIKTALDSKAKISESLAESVSFQELIEKLGVDNNILYGLSPLTIAKNIMALISKTDPNTAASMQMITGILVGIPENFTIGYSLKVRDRGVETKNIIVLGDFKQLINTLTLINEMEMF